MNWDALGAIAELLGSVAVIGTLGYLAIQVRHGRYLLEENKKIALSQVHQARADTRINYLMQAATLSTPAIDSLYGNPSNVHDLSPEELITAKNMMRSAIAVQDNVLYQHELDLLDDQTLPATNAVILAYYNVWEEMGLPITTRLSNHYESIR